MQMIAKKTFKYGGRKIAAGDTFEVKSASHGRTLRVAQLADDPFDTQRRRGRPRKVEAEVVATETPAVQSYQTRVLTAED